MTPIEVIVLMLFSLSIVPAVLFVGWIGYWTAFAIQLLLETVVSKVRQESKP